VSIGIGAYPRDGADATALLLAADAAMYRAKRRKKHR
jgi:GGDEF domain-containing protein